MFMCTSTHITYYSNENFSSNVVPKIIWTYWDDKNNIPELVKICQSTWKKNAPNYKIYTINKNTATKWVNMPKNWENLPPYRQSDIIRLLLIEKYGGIWLDASIILLKNFDTFINHNELTLFLAPGSTYENPVYENWFISSPPQNYLIKKWTKESLYAIYNPDIYIKQSPEINKKNVPYHTYLICHLALKNIYEKEKDIIKNSTVYESKKTAYFYHEKYKWNNLPYNLLKEKTFDSDKLMIKFTHNDRDSMQGMESKLLLKPIHNSTES